MNMKNCIDTMKRYSLARIPFIAFNSMERARAIDVFRSVSNDLTLPFYVHTMSKGMSELNGKTVNEDKSIMGALDFIAEQMRNRQNLTFILTEVSDIENDSMTSRYFLDIVTMAEECGGVIIVITTNQVWGPLQRLGMTVQLDLPDEEEMLQIITDNIEPYRKDIKIEWDQTDFREAATILAGVSKVEVQNVIASLVASRTIRKSDLTELRFAKNRLFSSIKGLEKIDYSESVLDVGGLDGLQKWLDDKQKLQTPGKRDELRSRGLQPPRGILLVGVPGCGKSSF